MNEQSRPGPVEDAPVAAGTDAVAGDPVLTRGAEAAAAGLEEQAGGQAAEPAAAERSNQSAADGVEGPGEPANTSGRHRSGRDRKPRRHRPWWIEIPVLLLISFTLTFLIQTFIAKVYYVPSGSMEQTLHGVQSGGDRILVSKIVYDFRDPHQGDVVVFNGPEKWAPEVHLAEPSNWFSKALGQLGSVVGIAPPDEKDFVKRVIAVGGQTVACCDVNGNVTVDGRPLNEPYIYQPVPFTDCDKAPDGLHYDSPRCFGPYKVPAGQLWVMGDHRSNSADSSYWCQGIVPKGSNPIDDCRGPIPADSVIGKAIFIVMPPSRWGSIGDPDIDPGNPQLGAAATSVVPISGGLLLTLGLRGGLAMTPARRRRRRARRRDRGERP